MFFLFAEMDFESESLIRDRSFNYRAIIETLCVFDAGELRSTPSMQSSSQAQRLMTRLMLVTGGGISGLGKGVVTGSVMNLLIARGYKVKGMKVDPYYNRDTSDMKPDDHGESYLTPKGRVTDLDGKTYQDFSGIVADFLTNGIVDHIFQARQRLGHYAGRTIQDSHKVDIIKELILRVMLDKGPEEEASDFLVCELGGALTDSEAALFLKAFSELRKDLGFARMMSVHVGWVPSILGEQKTKPTQISVESLAELGLNPNLLFCRSEMLLTAEVVSKIALKTSLRPELIIDSSNVSNLYTLPILYEERGVGKRIFEYFEYLCAAGLVGRAAPETKLKEFAPVFLRQMGVVPLKDPDQDGIVANLENWKAIDRSNSVRNKGAPIKIAVVGKYFKRENGTGKLVFEDAYRSVFSAVRNSANASGYEVEVVPLMGEDLEDLDDACIRQRFVQFNGIIVPGGFGARGTKGMIKAIKYARESGTPYFGICFGSQLALIEYAENVLKKKAHAYELVKDEIEENVRKRFKAEVEQALTEERSAEVLEALIQQKLDEKKEVIKIEAEEEFRAELDRIKRENELMLIKPLRECVVHRETLRSETSKQEHDMFLGEMVIQLTKGTKVHRIYQEHNRKASENGQAVEVFTGEIKRRHRHRFGIDPELHKSRILGDGLVFSGFGAGLPEIIEIPSHPHFFAIQAHPEFSDGPLEREALFEALFDAAISNFKDRQCHLEAQKACVALEEQQRKDIDTSSYTEFISALVKCSLPSAVPLIDAPLTSQVSDGVSDRSSSARLNGSANGGKVLLVESLTGDQAGNGGKVMQVM
ncbi:MAG: CTP synthase [Alphaproteobacteria bacterium]|nr:MAG: CTP synthase [Alphaproteobacteria bacterium]